MSGILLKCWTLLLMLAVVMAVTVADPFCAAANAQQGYTNSNKSWTDSMTSSIKQGFDKVNRAFNPKPTAANFSEDDPVSLKSKAKPSTDLFLAMARMYEQSGNFVEAEKQYQMALKTRPNDLAALLGYARLKERQNKPQEAAQLYQRAIKAHPKQASAYNNFGLYYARLNKLDEAAGCIARAIQLDPTNPLYRNNMATVLVDQDKYREAFEQLMAVHSEAAAYYNLGYLLTKKNQNQEALHSFTCALKADPSMEAAKKWIDYLQRTMAQERLAQHPSSTGVKVVSPTTVPQQQNQEGVESLPEIIQPQRLPPTNANLPSGQARGWQPAQTPAFEAPAGGDAPLPPASSNPALRPLPRVR